MPWKAAYLRAWLPMTVVVARYVDGGIDQVLVAAPRDPTSIPSAATIHPRATNTQKMPESGASRNNDVYHDRGSGFCICALLDA